MQQMVIDSFTQPRRPPLRYHGGKFRLAPWIVEHFPKHDIYVEVFGGAAGVLIRKPASRVEIYNDLDRQVVNFFTVLRTRTAELCAAIASTPYARDEFDLSYETTECALEAARRLVVRCYFGFGTCSINPNDSNGFRYWDSSATKSYPIEWSNLPPSLIAVASRFKNVIIENLHFRGLIPKFDQPNCVLYLDPPYASEARNSGGKGYVHEMSEPDHRELAWLVRSTKSKVVVSGYDCRLYNDLYKKWRRVEKATTANGQTGAVSRLEVLWLNF